MFCTNCGAPNEDTAIFCTNCGKKLTVPADTTKKASASLTESSRAPQSSLLKTEHPYHQLGGWLAVMTYGTLIIVVIQTILVALADFALLKAARYLGIWTILFAVILTIAQLIDLRLVWEFFRLVKVKDHRFFRYYETLSVLSLILEVVSVLQHSFSSSSIRSLLWTVLIIAIWIAYFCKSVRVRTYFGTDLYLKNSHFFRNVQAPAPADETSF